jgi:hypothetical protein
MQRACCTTNILYETLRVSVPLSVHLRDSGAAQTSEVVLLLTVSGHSLSNDFQPSLSSLS